MAALSTVVASVRDTLNDEDSTAYRVSNAKLVVYANDFIRELLLLRPDLFSTVGDIPCTDGEVIHQIPAAGLVLVDIFRVKNGGVVTESKRAHLDRFQPSWPTDDAAAAETWARHDKDPRRFFTYPKAPASQILVGQYAELPTLLADVAEEIPSKVPPAYYSAMHHYMVARAESKDDEYAVGGRAKLFLDWATLLTGAGKATKKEAETPEKERGDQVVV